MDNKCFNDSSSGERIGFSVDCCVDCGGSLLGNGLTMPIHCENIESPDGACPDEGPFYCGNKGGFHHDMDVMALWLGYCGGGCGRIGKGLLSMSVTAQQMGRISRIGEDVFYPRDIKSIRGGFSVFMGGPLLKLKPFEYYYQTKFGESSKDKHPRGNKFQRAVWSVKVANVWGNN